YPECYSDTSSCTYPPFYNKHPTPSNMTSAAAQVLTIIGTISLLTFIALFGHVPSLRRTPIGYAHRLLLQHIPRWLVKLDRWVTNGTVTHSMSRLANHLMNDKHPTVLVFYLLLVSVGLYMFVSSSWAQLLTTQ